MSIDGDSGYVHRAWLVLRNNARKWVLPLKMCVPEASQDGLPIIVWHTYKTTFLTSKIKFDSSDRRQTCLVPKERIDVLLVEQGYYESREKAKAAIMAGLVYAEQ